jgi:hypothetical protein
MHQRLAERAHLGSVGQSARKRMVEGAAKNSVPASAPWAPHSLLRYSRPLALSQLHRSLTNLLQPPPSSPA